MEDMNSMFDVLPPSYPGGPSDELPNEAQEGPPSIQAPEEIVLSYIPLPDPVSLPLPGPDVSSSIPFGAPPGYATSRLPIVPVIYTFSNYSHNSMLLLPPESHADSRPQYHISVRLNCFRPTSYITTVTRGASEDGQLVGDFDMGSIVDGTANIHGTVCLGGTERSLTDVFNINARKVQYNWRFTARKLRWGYTVIQQKTALECRDVSSDFVVANFYPPTKLRVAGRVPPLPQLEILPRGQARFDEILISILIVERCRTPMRL